MGRGAAIQGVGIRKILEILEACQNKGHIIIWSSEYALNFLTLWCMIVLNTLSTFKSIFLVNKATSGVPGVEEATPLLLF